MTTTEKEIMLKNGYSKTSQNMICKCELKIGQGKEKWGAEKRKRVLRTRDIRNFGGTEL